MKRSVLLLLLALIASWVPTAAALAAATDPSTPMILTDTPQYCAQLGKLVADRHSTLFEVKHLLAEGRDMCQRGVIRGGILRLRQALILLRHRPAREPPK